MKMIYHSMLFLTLFHAKNYFVVKTSAKKHLNCIGVLKSSKVPLNLHFGWCCSSFRMILATSEMSPKFSASLCLIVTSKACSSAVSLHIRYGSFTCGDFLNETFSTFSNISCLKYFFLGLFHFFEWKPFSKSSFLYVSSTLFNRDSDSLEQSFHHFLLPREIHFQKEFSEANLPFILPNIITSWVRSVSINKCNW